jgi:hypothetical protein
MTAFIEAIQDTQNASSTLEMIERIVQLQVQHNLSQFQEAIASQNESTLQLLRDELERLQKESSSAQGVFERLRAAIAPDVENTPEGEIATFYQAIDNLEKYGSIIPSSGDRLAFQLRIERNHCWSLFWQSIIRIFIRKLEQVCCGVRPIS